MADDKNNLRDNLADTLAVGGGLSGAAGLAGMPALEARLKLMKLLGNPSVDMDAPGLRAAVQDLEDIAHRSYDPSDFFEKYTRGGSRLANAPIQFTDASGVRMDGSIGDYIIHQKSRVANNPVLQNLAAELDALAGNKDGDGRLRKALDHVLDESSTLDSLAHYKGFSKNKRNAARTLLNELHEGVYPGRGMPLTAAGAGDKGTNLVDLLADVISKPKHEWNTTIAGWRKEMPDGSRLGGSGETTKFDDLLERVAKNSGIQDILDDKSLTAEEKAKRIKPALAKAYGVDLEGDRRSVAEYFDNAVRRDAAQQGGLLRKTQNASALSELDNPEAVKNLPKHVRKKLRRAAWRDMQGSLQAMQSGSLDGSNIDPRIRAVIEEQAANKKSLGAANAALENARLADNPELIKLKAQQAERMAERTALEDIAKKNVEEATAGKESLLAKINAGELADDDAAKSSIKAFDDIINGETTWHKLKGEDRGRWSALWDNAADTDAPGLNALNDRIKQLSDADAANIARLTADRDAIAAKGSDLANKLKSTFHDVASEGFSDKGLHRQMHKQLDRLDRAAGHSKINLSRLFKSDDLLDFATRLSASTMTQAPKGYSAIAWNMDKMQKFQKNLPKIKRGILGSLGLGASAMGTGALLTDENNETVNNVFKGMGALTGAAAGARAGWELNRVGGKAGKPALQGASKALYTLARKHKKLRGLRSAGKLLNAVSKTDTISGLAGRGLVGAAGGAGAGLLGAGAGAGAGHGIFKLLASDPKAEAPKLPAKLPIPKPAPVKLPTPIKLPAPAKLPVAAPVIKKPTIIDLENIPDIDIQSSSTPSLAERWKDAIVGTKDTVTQRAKDLISAWKQSLDSNS